MKTYEILGSVSFDVMLEVEADSYEEAEKEAKKLIIYEYNLDVQGFYHTTNSIEIDVTASFEEDE